MISILIPAYNCAPWLEAAVRSVIGQTYTDWELLIVDDGSTDATLDVARRMAEEDSRIRYMSLSHRGVAGVRNVGLDILRGEYVFFLDADDLLPEYTLGHLLEFMQNEEISMVAGRQSKFTDGAGDIFLREINKKGEYILNEGKYCLRILSPEESVEESLYQKGLEASLCGKLFRRSQLRRIRFIEGELYEDLDIFFRILLNGNKIAVSDLPVYLYRQRSGSIIHTFNRQRLVVLEVTRRICDYMERNYPSLLPAANDRRFSANFNMLQLLLHNSDMIDFSPEDKIDETYSFIRSRAREELFNSKVRLKNRLGALAALLLPRRMLFLLLKIYR